MKILHLSDTHGQHNRLPEIPWADVIIHSGDFCFGGPKREIIDFLNWFCYPPYKYKILIAKLCNMCKTSIIFKTVQLKFDIYAMYIKSKMWITFKNPPFARV